MTELKCPICSGEVHSFPTQNAYVCVPCGFDGTKELWKTLIETKKKLDWAMSCIYYAQKIIENYKATENLYAGLDTQDTTLIIRDINETIQRIEALEQINNKEV